MTSTRWLALSLTALVLACTEDPAPMGDTGTSSTGSSGGSQGPTSASASASATTSDGSSTDDGSASGSDNGSTSADSGSTGDLCEELPNDRDIAPVDIVVTNNTAEAIILVGAVDCPGDVGRYTIVDPLGPGIDAVHPNPAGCGSTCQSAGCNCPPVCNDAPWIRIEPAGTYTVAWTGALYTPEEAEVECLGRGCSSECYREINPPRGAYMVELMAMSLDQCPAGSCDCAPGPEGSCELAPDTNQLANLTASIETALPVLDPMLEISFNK